MAKNLVSLKHQVCWSRISVKVFISLDMHSKFHLNHFINNFHLSLKISNDCHFETREKDGLSWPVNSSKIFIRWTINHQCNSNCFRKFGVRGWIILYQFSEKYWEQEPNLNRLPLCRDVLNYYELTWLSASQYNSLKI